MSTRTFRKGPSTHKRLRCGSCGLEKLVPKRMIGKTLCGCTAVMSISSSLVK